MPDGAVSLPVKNAIFDFCCSGKEKNYLIETNGTSSNEYNKATNGRGTAHPFTVRMGLHDSSEFRFVAILQEGGHAVLSDKLLESTIGSRGRTIQTYQLSVYRS